jgi:NADH-quinone oxidoreductase subunit F
MREKIIIRKSTCGRDPSFDVYSSEGGYRSVEKALKMQPADIVEEVKKSGLRGRGGAGFPTGMKWSFLAKPEGVYPVTWYAMPMKVNPVLSKTVT